MSADAVRLKSRSYLDGRWLKPMPSGIYPTGKIKRISATLRFMLDGLKKYLGIAQPPEHKATVPQTIKKDAAIDEHLEEVRRALEYATTYRLAQWEYWIRTQRGY